MYDLSRDPEETLIVPGEAVVYWSRSRRKVKRSMTETGGKFRRSSDQVIAGVCGGIAEKFGWRPNRVRLAYVLLSIFSAAFPGILVYVILWLVVPGPEN